MVEARLPPKEWVSYSMALGIDLLSAHFVTHAFMPHAHEGFAVGVIDAGAERYRHRGAEQVAPAGSILVIPPGEVHTGQAGSVAGWTYHMAYPAAQWLQQAHEAVGGRGLPTFRGDPLDDPALAKLLRAAILALARGGDPLRAETLWLKALEALAGRHAKPGHRTAPSRSEPDAVRLIREVMHSDPVSSHSLSSLAELVGLTPTTLSRSFHAQLGLPPYTYLLGVRVALAKRLLSQLHSPAEAALLAGFADQSHLNQIFKRVLGVTPGVFQRANASAAVEQNHPRLVEDGRLL